MLDIKTLYIFGFGVLLTCAFYLEDVLSDKEQIEKNWIKIIFLVLLNGVLGGFVMVVVFYALDQYQPEMQLWVKMGISGAVATMGKDSIKIAHKRIKMKAEGI